MKTNEFILEKLKELMEIPSPTGYTKRAAEYVINELVKLGFSPKYNNKGCLYVDLGGNGTSTLLSAHIDTLGGMVSEVKSNGRLKITPLGGFPAVTVDGENLKVIARNGKEFEGSFQILDPSVHVNSKAKEEMREFEKMEVVLDEDVNSEEETKALGIAIGDIVAFDTRTRITESGYIKSRYLDDKLSVAILLGLAKNIADKTIKLNHKTYFLISTYEEVGHGAASIPYDIEEMLVVDMGCVGLGLECTEKKVSICAKDSAGPSNYEMTTKLINLAKENKIDYAVDVYPHYGSDADAALAAGVDVRHCLIGPGVYASHCYERSHIIGVENTLRLIEKYLEN